MREFSILFAAIFCTLLFSSTVWAQLCLKPHPQPACRTFFITEISYNFRANSAPTRTIIFPPFDGVDSYTLKERIFDFKRRHFFTSDLGLMTNLNARYAIGASHFIGMDNGGEFRGGFKIRVRRWLGAKSSLDLSTGMLLWNTHFNPKHPGFTAGVHFNMRDWFALTVLLESIRLQPSGYLPPVQVISDPRSDTAFYVGVKTGSTPGLIGNALAAATALALGIFILTVGVE